MGFGMISAITQEAPISVVNLLVYVILCREMGRCVRISIKTGQIRSEKNLLNQN